MATIFRFYNPTTTNHHYTTDKNEVAALRLSDDWNYEGAKWKTNDGDINVYRFFNKVDGRHLLTSDEVEKDNIINNLVDWNYEGIAFTTDTTEGIARYQHENGSFFYTQDTEEQLFIDNNLPHLTPNNSSFGGVPIDLRVDFTSGDDNDGPRQKSIGGLGGITFSGVATNQNQFAQDYSLHEGNDTFGGFFNVGFPISVDGGNGDDTISLSYPPNSELNDGATLYGGNGADTFIIHGSVKGGSVFEANLTGGGWGNVIIEDFDPTENDQLMITSNISTLGGLEPLPWTSDVLSISEISSENGDYTKIDLRFVSGIDVLTGTISLLGVSNDVFNDYILG